MGLFKSKQEKQAETERAAAGVAQFTAMSVDELAAVMLPAFGPANKPRSHGTFQVVTWLVRDIPGAAGQLRPLLQPAREAMQALEHAELIMRRVSSSAGNQRYEITRLGEQALSDGDVRERLASR